MGDVIEISTSLRIERPPSEVRAQYRDIDHHIRHNVHPGIHYTWEESKPGERKIRTEFRLLGKKQYDVSLLVDAPDGSFVIDYLEGANAGTKLVHEFLPEGEGATTVKITAHVPGTTGRKLLGPLFGFGVKQVIKKALKEDKADLEKGTFKPGAVAGNLPAALELVRPIQARVRALGPLGADVARAVLDLAALVAAADGEVDDAERDALLKVTTAFGLADVDTSWADAALESAKRAAVSEALEVACARLGARMKELGVGDDGLAPAALVAQASFGVALAEIAVFRQVAAAAGIPESAVEQALASADESLSAQAT